MPLSKVDQEKRIVSGFATLDNVDRQSDIVTTEASLKAFAEFRGNIREMHEPIAVGKMVAFKEDKYFDPETKKMYSGVYVSAYVSKGAQDTWEKVLDGTLSGFSIGGRMNKWDDAYDSKLDSNVRVIKDYTLVELSLVDSPANQFANILSVQKKDGKTISSGTVTETTIENVFYDAESGLVKLSDEESVLSPLTGQPMKNIGFVEKSDNEKTEMIKFLVDSAKGINLSKMTKEVSPMTDNTQADVVETTTVADAASVAPEAAEAVADNENTEKAMKPEADEAESAAEAASETQADEDAEAEAKKSDEAEEVAKADAVAESIAEIKNTLTSAFSDLVSTIKSMQTEIADLTKSIDSVKTEVNESKTVFNEFGKRVDAVEADTAFRKSGDLGEIFQEQPEQQVEKSLWGGRFLKTADLFK
jgi:hypothetical protein